VKIEKEKEKKHVSFDVHTYWRTKKPIDSNK